MSSKIKSKKEKGNLTKSIIIGALFGGGIAISIGLLGIIGDLAGSGEGVLALGILGTSIGAAAGILIGLSTRSNTSKSKSSQNNEQPLKKAFRNISDNARIQLREEQLEISKELVQTADITSHKEFITEEKTVTVPVTHEELVIEKRSLDNNSDNDNEYCEIMRIPINEEQVEVVKNTVKLEDVSIYTKQHQELEHIDETLKKEVAHIETTGNATLVDKDVE